MQSNAVLHKGKHLDFSSMEKGEISKNLFGQVQWEEILRSGVFLQHRDHQLLERAQTNLGVVIDNNQDAKDLSGMLLKIAENCTSNLTVQQYVFTRIEEILGIGSDYSDADADAFGTKNAHLFTSDGVHLSDSSFVRALSSSDIYLQRSASIGFACLLSKCQGNIRSLIDWITTKLQSTSNGVWDMALPALSMLCRSQTARTDLVASGVVELVVSILKRLGANGHAQFIYELTFILWALSLGEFDFNPFISSGSVSILVEVLSSSPTRKVTRVAIAALRNLSNGENDKLLNEMLAAGLLKLVENMIQSNVIKQAADLEVESDFKAVHDVLTKNYRELSRFERWSAEVHSGNLKWGILHTEKFWKENAKFVETDNYSLLKTLISLAQSSNTIVACVALYDIGEFTRFYPNGRVVVSRLGGKDIIMQMMTHSNADIQRHTLQCISKIMVNNWEFLR